MKKFFSSMKNRLILLVYGMMAPVISFAQSGKSADAQQVLDKTYQEINKLTNNIINIVSIVGALVGVIMLAPNLLKYLKGDPSSNDALMKVGAGIIIFVILLQVIRVALLNG